jgi:hypothetical protein
LGNGRRGILAAAADSRRRDRERETLQALKHRTFLVDLHSSRAVSKLAVDPGCHDMSTAREDGLDTAKGNLGPKELEAVQKEAHHILGPSEVVQYAFCTTGTRYRGNVIWQPGMILFTTHRIISRKYGRIGKDGRSAYLFYPYTTLVSVSLHITTAERMDSRQCTYLKFRDADIHDEQMAKHVWIFVETTSAEDNQHLSAATLCMNRVPASMEIVCPPLDNQPTDASAKGLRQAFLFTQ